MLQIIPQGDDKYHLVGSDGRAMGWIRGAAIRIGAFATEREALDAAVRGARALDDYLRGGVRRPADFPGPDADGDDLRNEHAAAIDTLGTVAGADVRLVHDGAYEWVVLGRRPAARLIRPSSPQSFRGAPEVAGIAGDAVADARPPAAERPFALEFVVPASVPPMARLTVARVLHHALARDDGSGAVDGVPRRPGASGPGTRSGARNGASGPGRPSTPSVSTSDRADPPPAA